MKPELFVSQRNKIRKVVTTALPLSSEKIFIVGCVLTAFLIRFFLIPQNTVISWDGVYYATLGEKINSGDIFGGISAYWSPLYSFLIGIASLFFKDSESAGRFVSLFAGTILIIPVYFLIRNFYGRETAYFGTILVVIHPMLIRSSVWVMTESVYTLIFTTIILTGWYALRKGKPHIFFLTGLLLGTAYLVKPEAIAFVGLFFVLTLGAKFFRQQITFRVLLKGYSLLLLGFAIFLLPYVALIHQKTGNWTISQKLQSNVPGISDHEDGRKLDNTGNMTNGDKLYGDVYESQLTTQSHSPIKSSSANSLSLESETLEVSRVKGILFRVFSHLGKEVKQFIPEIFPLFYIFFLIAVFGFFYQPWTRLRAAREIYLFSFFFCTLIGYATSVIEVRYLVPIIPIMIGWIAHGILAFSDWTTKSLSPFMRINRRIKPIFAQVLTLLVLIASLILSFSAQMSLEKAENLPLEEKQAGLWIKNQTSLPSLIMAASPIAAYYAGAKHIYLPDEDFLTVLEYAKRKKVNYLIFDTRRVKDTPDAFPRDEEGLPNNFKLVYKDERNPSNKILVYQLAN